MSFRRDSRNVDVILFPEIRKALTGRGILINTVSALSTCNKITIWQSVYKGRTGFTYTLKNPM